MSTEELDVEPSRHLAVPVMPGMKYLELDDDPSRHLAVPVMPGMKKPEPEDEYALVETATGVQGFCSSVFKRNSAENEDSLNSSLGRRR